MFLTIEQIKAARALLKWNQKELASHAGLHDDQIHSFESGRTRSLEVLESIHKAFVSHNLDFVDGGVVRKKYEIRTLHGQQGFWDFYDDIYETIRTHGGDILVNNVDERLFFKWLGKEKWDSHVARMDKLEFQQRLIICEGDMNFAADFKTTEYRWAAPNEFSPTPFYLYGHRLAMLMFEENDVSVFIIDQPKITESYRILFNAAWERAKVPPAKPAAKGRKKE
jgi:transcriptional regulator with XRE-family HTH domain